jgi:hypothetical protein
MPKTKKTPFKQLPIVAAIRGSKLTKARQDEVLRKLEKYYENSAGCYFNGDEQRLAFCLVWSDTTEGFEYWHQMHTDSGL